MDEEIQRFIRDEVARQVLPIAQSVEAVSKQNGYQSGLLTMQVKKIEDLERWTRKLWSNGSGGPPGYLEIAREQDEDWKSEVRGILSGITAQGLKDEGKKQLLVEQEKQADRRLVRWKYAASIASIFFGSWVLTLIRPLLHALFTAWAGAIH